MTDNKYDPILHRNARYSMLINRYFICAWCTLVFYLTTWPETSGCLAEFWPDCLCVTGQNEGDYMEVSISSYWCPFSILFGLFKNNMHTDTLTPTEPQTVYLSRWATYTPYTFFREYQNPNQKFSLQSIMKSSKRYTLSSSYIAYWTLGGFPCLRLILGRFQS